MRINDTQKKAWKKKSQQILKQKKTFLNKKEGEK